MISVYKNKNIEATEDGQTKRLEFVGLSTDTKPTEQDGEPINNGAVFLEMNTGKLFFFDAENEQWKEI